MDPLLSESVSPTTLSLEKENRLCFLCFRSMKMRRRKKIKSNFEQKVEKTLIK